MFKRATTDLANLKGLTTLSLSGTQITGTGLEKLVEHHKSLKHLFLDKTQFQEDALMHLNKLISLLLVSLITEFDTDTERKKLA